MRPIRNALSSRLAIAASVLIAAVPASAAGIAKSTRDAGSAAPRAAEVDCLAEAIYFEAGGTGSRGESAVAHVIVNRTDSPSFPDSVCGVVRQGCQFSYRCDGRSDALVDGERRASALKTARAVLSGSPDPTRGALFFHAANAKPGWFNSRDRIGTIGGNTFYR